MAKKKKKAPKPADKTPRRRTPATEKADVSGAFVAPNRWVVQLDKGKSYRLRPAPQFPPQKKACVTAFSDSDATLGITVRRADQTTVRNFVGQRHVSGTWNSGLGNHAWEIRVLNLSGPDGLTVTIDTGHS